MQVLVRGFLQTFVTFLFRSDLRSCMFCLLNFNFSKFKNPPLFDPMYPPSPCVLLHSLLPETSRQTFFLFPRGTPPPTVLFRPFKPPHFFDFRTAQMRLLLFPEKVSFAGFTRWVDPYVFSLYICSSPLLPAIFFSKTCSCVKSPD